MKLSLREVFFSTFYMLDYEVTIWGNYNKKFPVFYKDNEAISIYEKIAKQTGLSII